MSGSTVSAVKKTTFGVRVPWIAGVLIGCC